MHEIKTALKNKVYLVKKGESYSIPFIVRANKEWLRIPEEWTTIAPRDLALIECEYSDKELKEVEFSRQDTFYIRNTLWKIVVDLEDIQTIEHFMEISGSKNEMAVTTWQKRPCMYAALKRYNEKQEEDCDFDEENTSTISKKKKDDRIWLHRIIVLSQLLGDNYNYSDFKELNDYFCEYVMHHINGASNNNSKSNLQMMPKAFHDSINHNQNIRRRLHELGNENYTNPQKHINEDVKLMESIYYKYSRNYYFKEIEEHYLSLITSLICPKNAQKILKKLKKDIKGLQIPQGSDYNPHESIIMNPHLTADYLEHFELTHIFKKLIYNSEPHILQKKKPEQFSLF